MMRVRTIVCSAAVGSLALCGSALAQQDDGGPDYFEVFDLSSKTHLNLRSGASLENRIITGLHMGDKVKNLGCNTTANGRWCNVETAKGTKGFAFGAFLKETSAPEGAMKAEAPAAVPAPAAFAMGKMPCQRYNADPTTECDFGIMRFGPGKARLQVTWPDATKRMFGIYANTVTSGDGKVDATASADGAIVFTLNAVGMATERYTVPKAVITP